MGFFSRSNTAERGRVRYIIFREGETWYGVALEFNLVVEGDDQASTFLNLQEAIRGYVTTTRQHKIRPMVLNQQPSKEYSQLWKDLEAGKEPKLQTSFEVGNYGFIAQPA